MGLREVLRKASTDGSNDGGISRKEQRKRTISEYEEFLSKPENASGLSNTQLKERRYELECFKKMSDGEKMKWIEFKRTGRGAPQQGSMNDAVSSGFGTAGAHGGVGGGA